MAKPDVTKAKILLISAKCRDLFWCALLDNESNQLADYDGYVPDFMPDEHYGDYVKLDIDIETGRILNWKKPSPTALRKVFKDSEHTNHR